jgi:RNase P subunit RPR2
VCPNCHQLTRVGHKTTEDGKVRFCRKCEAVLTGG